MAMGRLVLLTTLAFGAALPSVAGITYTCDSSIAADGPAGLCNMLNGAQVSGVYGGIFGNNATANIYIEFAGSGLAGSNLALNSVSYSDYLAALSTKSNSTAFQSLAVNKPSLYDGDNVAISSALGSALGILSANAGMEADGVTSCTLLVDANCYNGIVTIGSSANPIYYPSSPSDPTSAGWDYFSLVEHETDEIIGTISCIGTNAGAPVNQCTDTNNNQYVSPADLFRYSAPSTLSFLNTANGTPAYFSIDGGVTQIAPYNNSPNNEDYGDWIGGCGTPRVQNASACQSVNMDLTNDGGAEVTVLNAVGFNLAPEPGTIVLLGASLATLAFLHSRRRRRKI